MWENKEVKGQRQNEEEAMAAQYEEEGEETIAIRAGAATARPTCVTIKLNNTSNLFLNIKINGHSCEAMVDNGATKNFITPKRAMNWG